MFKSSSSSGLDPQGRPIPISEFYASHEITVKQETPAALEHHDIIVTTSVMKATVATVT